MGLKMKVLCGFGLMLLAWVSTPAQASGFEARRAADAASSRGIIFPTAETLPEGKFSVSSLQLFVIGAGYGITDTTTAGVLTWVPIFEDQPVFGIFTVKQKLFENERIQLSVQPDFVYVSEAGVSGGTVGVAVMGSIVWS